MPPRSQSVKDEMDIIEIVQLLSPIGAPALSFELDETREFEDPEDVQNFIKAALELHPKLKENFDFDFIPDFDRDDISAEELRDAIQHYNRAVQKYVCVLFAPTLSINHLQLRHPTSSQLRIVYQSAYNEAVGDENKLNKHYKPFSSQIYGETTFEMIESMMNELNVKPTDVFIDLGSGVGQTIIQAAGGYNIKECYGIEISKYPAEIAKNMKVEFIKRMNWLGLKFSKFEMHHGDFLNQKYFNLICQKATILFINNFAFEPELQNKIETQLLPYLKAGTRIITTSSYSGSNRKAIQKRRSLDGANYEFDIRKLKGCETPCSWTPSNIPYYLHIVKSRQLTRHARFTSSYPI